MKSSTNSNRVNEKETPEITEKDIIEFSQEIWELYLKGL